MNGFSTAELLEVTGLTATNFKQLVARHHLVLSSGGRVGSGRPRVHSAQDVLQASLLVELGRIGVTPRRASLFWWHCIRPNLHWDDALLLLHPRTDESDLDYRLVLRDGDGDDGLDREDAPAVLALVNIAAVKRRVAAKLTALRSGSAAA